MVRIIRMRNVPFIDSTGVKNLENFLNRTIKGDIHVIISGLQPLTFNTLRKTGILEKVGLENISPNIEAALDKAREIISDRYIHYHS
jgi:sulfate permease, SulP family